MQRPANTPLATRKEQRSQIVIWSLSPVLDGPRYPALRERGGKSCGSPELASHHKDGFCGGKTSQHSGEPVCALSAVQRCSSQGCRMANTPVCDWEELALASLNLLGIKELQAATWLDDPLPPALEQGQGVLSATLCCYSAPHPLCQGLAPP